MSQYICFVKKVFLILALLILLKPMFPIIEYVVRYDYISKVLCINKDKPKLECNGQCHLMKQAAKNAESDGPISTNKKLSSQEILFVFFEELTSQTILPLYFHKTEKANSFYSNLYSYKLSGFLFRPPTIIS